VLDDFKPPWVPVAPVFSFPLTVPKKHQTTTIIKLCYRRETTNKLISLLLLKSEEIATENVKC
jgi:hypothetical protein